MPFRAAALFLLVFCAPLAAHEGHDHAEHSTDAKARAAAAPPADAITGSSAFRFRYNAELSKLPKEITEHIEKAHGGFAKGPDGEVYFGLKNVGPVRISPDLRTKTVIPSSEGVRTGGLHNTTYVDRDGGLLILPDNEHAEIHILTVKGEEAGRLGRPDVNEYYEDESHPYRPTDVEVAGNGTLYVCDGYSPGKYVLTASLEGPSYGAFWFGGPIPGKGRTPGKFSTNHGLTLDPQDGTLVIADRERQWTQRFDLEGKFIDSVDIGDADPCDVDFVDWQGEQLMVVGCLRSAGKQPGVVKIVKEGEVVATLRPKQDLGIAEFDHIHNAAGVVVDGKLYVLCYGWNPGCYAVLEHVAGD